jgi:hypothetical protein
VIAELGAAGSAYRRVDLRSAFGNLPEDLPRLDDPEAPGLALEAAPLFRSDSTSIRATIDGARADVAHLRYRAFSAEVDVVAGDTPGTTIGELLLVRDGVEPLAIELRQDDVAIGGCSTSRPGGAPVLVSRVGNRITLGTRRGPTVECPIVDLPEWVGIALRLRRDAALRRMSVVRAE